MAIDQELINRINELAKKKKEIGLTNIELEEQKVLREKYLTEFRAGFKQKIESVDFIKQFTIKKANINKDKITDLQTNTNIKEIQELANTYLITYYCQKISDKEIKAILKK